MDLILATNNSGKQTELQAMLKHITCIPQKELGIEDITETGLSFIENAILKARHASTLGKKPALADDSGLVIPALHGQPGIYSARYAGLNATDEANIQLLLKKMAHVSKEQRHAFFYCAIAVVEYAEDPIPKIATGKLSGKIILTPRGNHGFGYDPIFFIPKYQCTLAELSTEIKNQISHRAQALKQLGNVLQD